MLPRNDTSLSCVSQIATIAYRHIRGTLAPSIGGMRSEDDRDTAEDRVRNSAAHDQRLLDLLAHSGFFCALPSRLRFSPEWNLEAVCSCERIHIRGNHTSHNCRRRTNHRYPSFLTGSCWRMPASVQEMGHGSYIHLFFLLLVSLWCWSALSGRGQAMRLLW